MIRWEVRMNRRRSFILATLVLISGLAFWFRRRIRGPWWRRLGYRPMTVRPASRRPFKIFVGQLLANLGEGRSPAVLLLHGGGWTGGSPQELGHLGNRLRRSGMVVFLAEYGLLGRDGTTPETLLDDPLAAYQEIVDHADDLGIDRNRIAVLGGSAGGHLAFWVARRESEPRPAALILLAPLLTRRARASAMTG